MPPPPKPPSVSRAPWHRSTDRWQVQRDDGMLLASDAVAWSDRDGCYVAIGAYYIDGGYWGEGPQGTPPVNPKNTLLRIV